VTSRHSSPLLATLERAGGVKADYHGTPLVRHFGDPTAEYRAATESAAVFDRSHRTRLIVTGRAPGKMMSGVLTGRMPTPPVETDGVWAGRATYHAVLTPKGKMVSDLWLTQLGADDAEGYLLDVPVAGREGLLALFKRVLPPRFAAVRDAIGDTAMISVVGPDAAELLSRLALNGRVGPDELRTQDEGEWRAVGPPERSLLVARIAEVRPDAWSVTGSAAVVTALWERLVEEGAHPAGHDFIGDDGAATVQGNRHLSAALDLRLGRPPFRLSLRNYRAAQNILAHPVLCERLADLAWVLARRAVQQQPGHAEEVAPLFEHQGQHERAARLRQMAQAKRSGGNDPRSQH